MDHNPTCFDCTSIDQLVEHTVAHDVFLTVRLLPADFEGSGPQSREHQSAGSVWHAWGTCICQQG